MHEVTSISNVRDNSGGLAVVLERGGVCGMQVCKYIDIPLQHISNMTLLSMNRPPQEHTVKLLQKLRQRIPGLVLRTTFISGFPGDLFS